MLIESPNIISNPVVSVIVLTYNHHDFIRPCLDSILSQNFSMGFELIIGDDCSKDDTRDICLEYQRKYPDVIRLMFQETNKGVSGNYADLLSLTRAEFIAQIAGDDFWYDNFKLQKQYDFMISHPNCGLCYTNCYTCDAKGMITKQLFLSENQDDLSFESHLLNAGTIAPLTWMFTKKLADMYHDGGYSDESFAMALIALANFDVVYLPEVTAVYRRHEGSLSAYSNSIKFYRQCKGVFFTQIDFVKAYRKKVSVELEDKIRSKGYIDLLPHALLAEDKDFVEEVKNYFEGKGIYFPQLLSMAEELNKARSQAYHAWNSKAYKLGRTILDPIKTLKRK